MLGRPEYIEPLREEIAEVIKEDGVEKDENGQVFLSKSSMGKLKKLDSFIKESQRTSPLSFGKLFQFKYQLEFKTHLREKPAHPEGFAKIRPFPMA